MYSIEAFVLGGALLAAASGLSDEGTNPTIAATRPRPYQVNVDPTFIEQTLTKVKDYRPSINIDEPPWEDGPPARNISQVRNHWLQKYNWTEVQDNLNNQHPHFMTTVTETGSYGRPLDVYFVHRRSNRSDATPLLMLHGWPSTSLDWFGVIDPLTIPDNASDPAFHIIAPDLPGFGFSAAPTKPGLAASQIAHAYVELMHQLGYEKWAIYSTDLGFYIGTHMSNLFEKQVLLHTTDFFLVKPNSTDLQRYERNETTPEGTRYIASQQNWETHDMGYLYEQTTRPLALALAMTDSPVGFLGWMWQLVYAVSDGYEWSAQSLITRSLMLFIPGTYGNMRLYNETVSPEKIGLPVTKVPTAVLQYGWTSAPYPGLEDYQFAPPEWIRQYADLRSFFRTANGGHFPYQTMPQSWLKQFRKAARKVLQGNNPTS